jgi:hypothetical protein
MRLSQLYFPAPLLPKRGEPNEVLFSVSRLLKNSDKPQYVGIADRARTPYIAVAEPFNHPFIALFRMVHASCIQDCCLVYRSSWHHWPWGDGLANNLAEVMLCRIESWLDIWTDGS